MRVTYTDDKDVNQTVEVAALVGVNDDGTGRLQGMVGDAAKVNDSQTPLYTPARDIFIDWFFGNEDSNDAALTANTFNAGSWIDMSEINSDMRNIIIQCETGTTLDYDYNVYFSRNGLDADQYLVGGEVTIGTQVYQVPIAQFTGYDLYVKIEIRPETGQSADQLLFKAYMTGRGG